MKISKLLNEIPEPLRPLFKPLVVALAVFMTITSVEFVLLAAAELKDGNYWSFSVRMAGLVGTFVAGRFVWKGLGEMKANLTNAMPGVGGNGVPVPVLIAVGADVAEIHSDVTTRVKPCKCGYPFPMPSSLCTECWIQNVEERILAIEARQGVVAGAISTGVDDVDDEAPQSVQASRE